jgi:hypothetical protein
LSVLFVARSGEEGEGAIVRQFGAELGHCKDTFEKQKNEKKRKKKKKNEKHLASNLALT